MGAPDDGVRWGLLDEAIARVSPRWARRRFAERVALSVTRRGYDAAARGRGTDGWRTAGTSADAEIGAAGGTLRDRMRDLVRNDPLAAQALQVLVNNIVGPGIRPRARTGDKALDKKVNDLWKVWSKQCDAHGHTDVYGLQALAVREMLEGGDAFALRRPMPAGRGLTVPLQIEIREADHLDGSKSAQEATGARISQGIETDRTGRRSAYWMFPEHPGERTPLARSLQSVRIPATQVAHLFERQRIQSRGTPWGVPAIRSLRDLGDWHHAELLRKKTEACLVGVVIREDDATPNGTTGRGLNGRLVDGSGNVVEEFSPGMLAYANGGEDVKFNQPAATGGVAEWNRVQMHIVAAGWRVPYALMTGDMSQANFASNRIGLNEFRRMVDQLQWKTVIPMFCEPMWRWFVEAAQLAGLLPDRPIPAEWATPRFESVNPLQDVAADLAEVRAGFATRSQMIARRGYDPEEILEEWAADAQAADGRTLVFDSDPRHVSKVGVAQSTASGAVPDGTDAQPPETS
ncbi:phage portal protein [Rubellimicrobium aerolatum]|uniref:Phage portal protein n=1 Tax=Rubellimicrobium aerolatum TaxID=490979 RepID=A0ABW0SF98_9RHOB|nr:phage portal protein [Rubellimicrobium aerolatum]MBP1806468.1 lambda family phage portal protein [Rubellimicrobium aerolatum]